MDNSNRNNGTIETHSIDFVPLSERHGKVWHQGPFWFTGAFVLPSMATGFIGPSLGLGLGWSMLAIVLGMGFGTAFMAFHANQGPRLGLPQMIQSRAQFGVRGSMFPLLVAVFIYLGYNVFNLIISREAIATVAPDSSWWYVAFMVIALFIAVVGYRLLHVVQRYLSYALILSFLIYTVIAVAHLSSAHSIVGNAFMWKIFLIQFAATGGYQISYAVYVSDYSRYLPEDASAKKLIAWTYAGATIGAAWMGCLGALLASHITGPDPVATVRTVGNSVIPGFGTFVVLISVPALVGTTSINSYGAMLTGTSLIDSFRHVRPTRLVRVIGLIFVSAVALIATYAIPTNFIGSFNTFLTIMLYLLVPWTAINLTDFYFVRRGHYDVNELFNHHGIYGAWAWRGLVAYFAAFAAMIPFFVLSFYTGPAATALGGADISFVVGLVVAAGVYIALCPQRYRDQKRDEVVRRASLGTSKVVGLTTASIED